MRALVVSEHRLQPRDDLGRAAQREAVEALAAPAAVQHARGVA
jgi:hypothetical protein